MQLTATSKAQFFIQNEYYHVEIKENSVLLSSIGSEEHIPFTVWNGKVNVKARPVLELASVLRSRARWQATKLVSTRFTLASMS